MRDNDSEVIEASLSWLRAGESITLVTLAGTYGSAPREPGSLLALRGRGEGLIGSVSGGCVEQELLSMLREGALNLSGPGLLRVGADPDQARRLRLPCGGQLELVIEPLQDPESLAPVADALARRQRLTRTLNLESGDVRLAPAEREATLGWDGRRLEKVFGPVWRLLLIGAVDLSAYVAQMAAALGYEVICCDPREEYAGGWCQKEAARDRRPPDEAVQALADDPRSAVLALSHDPRLDDLALMEALDSRAFYVGALGSRRNNDARRKRLAQVGVSPRGISRLHGPIGLPIGSRNPPEIAVSILAELIAVRRGAEAIQRDPVGGDQALCG
jgi:xanthine dehydrogenase accessory factor